MSHNTELLVSALVAVIGLVIAIARFKLHAFVALTLAALFVGLCAGADPVTIAHSFQVGVGAMLGSIAVVVGLGVILGKLLAESGAAEVIAHTLVGALGDRRAGWTMLLVAFTVGMPVFFTVGLVLLMPIVVTMARETRSSVLPLGIPLLAGLSVAHGLLPPHPGPMAAIATFNATVGDTDVGKTIFYALLIGFPTAVVAGPVFARLIAHHPSLSRAAAGSLVMIPGTRDISPGSNPGDACSSSIETRSTSSRAPGFWPALFTVLLPVLLMLLAALAGTALSAASPLKPWADFFGDPNVAMLVAVLVAFYSLGCARGFDRRRILQMTNDCLGPVATILLVVGAGGGFSKVLETSGVGTAVAALAGKSALSPMLLGWLTAALIRIGTGSATVAITMASGLIAPLAAATPGLNRELLVVAMGAGSLILSHVNDGGFWFVKEYFGLDVTQTLKTWTVLETIASVVALVLVLVLNSVI